MIIKFHQGLTIERWAGLSRDKQILNIFSELTRSLHGVEKKDKDRAKESIERCLELIDMTIETTPATQFFSFVKELLRLREMLADTYCGSCENGSEIKSLLKELSDLNETTHNLELQIS